MRISNYELATIGCETKTIFIRVIRPNKIFTLRTRRQSDYDYSFSREINDCDSDRCTLMRCTVGPMARDDIVTFKIRSRLFTETQIKVCLIDAVFPWKSNILAAITSVFSEECAAMKCAAI